MTSEVLRCSYQEFTTRCHQLVPPAGAVGSAKKPSSPNVNCSSAVSSESGQPLMLAWQKQPSEH
jgi:hypothetical protein